MNERKWALVGPVALTAAGTNLGKATLTSTLDFKVKMRVSLSHPTPGPTALEIKRINSDTELELGPIGGKILERTDISAYPTGSTILATEQNRPDIPLQEIIRAIYDEEPVVALRSSLVDRLGQPLASKDGLKVIIENALVDKKFDDVVMSYDINENLTQAVFKYQGAVVATVNMTYDLDSNMTRAYLS